MHLQSQLFALVFAHDLAVVLTCGLGAATLESQLDDTVRIDESSDTGPQI